MYVIFFMDLNEVLLANANDAGVIHEYKHEQLLPR
jgi:hypothetical protein